jgi:hypothetical protein
VPTWSRWQGRVSGLHAQVASSAQAAADLRLAEPPDLDTAATHVVSERVVVPLAVAEAWREEAAHGLADQRDHHRDRYPMHGAESSGAAPSAQPSIMSA